MSQPATGRSRPNYGIDAPGVVRNFVLLGLAGLLVAGGASWGLGATQPAWARMLSQMSFWPGVTFLVCAAVMLWGSKFGKLRERDRLLDALAWRGDELVLDVGCGHGLLLLGAAKRLTTGKAVGVDLWQSADQAGNRPEATWENARREGVADRIELKDGDARRLPFGDARFDVVLSSWALHNISNAAERHQALREIVRVLKPGGRLALLDIQHTADYVRVLRDCGLTDVRRSGPRFLFVIPTYTVTATRPAGSG